MSQLIIAKFGGTSVANAQAMNRCADLILTNPNVRLVVLSASSGVTNALVALAAGCDGEERERLIALIREKQDAIINELALLPAVKHEINHVIENISALAESARLATSPALADELVSNGELMSTLLFVELLRQRKVEAVWFDVRDVMVTNAQFGKAEPDLGKLQELCQRDLQPLLSQSLVVTQGFIGREAHGRTTTLGRGGSDYTAALLGEALSAQRIDIWTDVAGIHTTDPRIVANAKRIESVSFAEAAEMATFGAKILHPATLLPAIRCDIPVFVGSSKEPEAGGTLVCKKIEDAPLFRALALRRGQTLLTLHSLSMLHAHGFLARVFDVLARYNISVDLLTTSEVSIALTLDTTGQPTGSNGVLTGPLLSELSALCRVEIEGNLALVALVGNRLSEMKGVGKQIFSVLDEFNVRLICHGASNHNLCFLVSNQDADSIIKQLHLQLFE